MTQETITKQFKYLLMLAMIVTGTINTLTYKIQDTTEVYEVGYPGPGHMRDFFHPYMQSVAMFLGEAMCIILFIVWKKRNKKEYDQGAIEASQKGLQTKLNYFEIMIPALADLITQTLQRIALVFISASVYQMVRGGVIVINAIGSVVFLNRVLYRSHKIGCALVVLGILIVGLQSMLLDSSHSKYSIGAQLISILLILVSLFTDSINYLYEEHLLKKYYLHTYQLVGIEGCWGLLMYAALMPILCYTHCPFGETACVYSPSGQPHFESVSGYFVQAAQNRVLASMCIIGVFSLLLFNIAGVSITKYISALVRSLVDVTRTSVVWLVCIIITVTGLRNLGESTEPLSICLELLGFVLMVLGNLVYQQIIVLPFFKQEELQQEEEEQVLTDEDEYQKQYTNSNLGISLTKNQENTSNPSSTD